MENVKRGKLKLKRGGKIKLASKRKQKKQREKDLKRCDVEKHTIELQTRAGVEVDDMTPAQRRHAEHKKKREQEEIEKMASKTYRERIEELNQHLGSLTEHHDVPRVSAAGNG
ncbi:Conserved alpha-helical protein [Plasmopara halstedii]|uniref:Conserved alpha-helical protein n=1 Tax=Plasmopara halstedii TaxID=4781 RepID=A0A0P1A8L4_PLAHL|nr:Conserved alpha-helical protein [Plasmopara halstedii]CEG36510.1 Conserved alpha-helical protein [Plasmopara halstedii]|eukprot:XP_024572879.1 Conserved alpha-helical protein [Plasmopara halstedii]